MRDIWALADYEFRLGNTYVGRRLLCWFYALSRVVGSDAWRGIFSYGCHDDRLREIIVGSDRVSRVVRELVRELRRTSSLETLAVLMVAEHLYGGVLELLTDDDIIRVATRNGTDLVMMMFGREIRRIQDNELRDHPYLLLGGLLGEGGRKWMKFLESSE